MSVVRERTWPFHMFKVLDHVCVLSCRVGDGRICTLSTACQLLANRFCSSPAMQRGAA